MQSGRDTFASCFDTIDTMLHALEQQTGIETVVAIVPSIGDMEWFDFLPSAAQSMGSRQKEKIRTSLSC